LLQITAKPEGTSTLIAEAAELDWPANLQASGVTTQQSNDSCGVQISFTAAAGRTYAFDNLSPSHLPPVPANL
jgi:hypothetical protein